MVTFKFSSSFYECTFKTNRSSTSNKKQSITESVNASASRYC
ncbi:Uncharacterised protein [Vibrio cholerae]|nr:Uncharacterised protein [Vibrio cholerae]